MSLTKVYNFKSFLLITFLQNFYTIPFTDRGSLCFVLPSEALTLKRQPQLLKLGDILFCVLSHHCYDWYMLFLTVTFFLLTAITAFR
jgi:hypothetical protein